MIITDTGAFVAVINSRDEYHYLVVLAEELRDGRILTVDRRDFTVYRWNNTQPFQNLLFSDYE